MTVVMKTNLVLNIAIIRKANLALSYIAMVIKQTKTISSGKNSSLSLSLSLSFSSF